jgi:replicative DNA helicase
MVERNPPHSFEAEQCVLGAVLADNRAFAEFDFLEPAAFADPAHGKLWAAIARLIGRGQPASPVTLRTYVESDADLAKGGIAYLGALVAASAPIIDAVAMGRIVHELHIQRQAQTTMREALDGADALDPMAAIAETAQRLGDLADSAAPDETCRPFSAIADSVMGAADSIYKRGGGLSGLPTGFEPLDAMLGGLHPGELVILAARPSMGKTALATDIGFNIASAGVPAGFLSLEMTADQIGARIVAANAGVPGYKIRQGTMTGADMDSYMAAGIAHRDLPLHIDDRAALTIAGVQARARRMKRAHGIGLLIVDYLQLLSGGDRRDGRTQEISEITRGLKTLAKDLKIPILALSQLSRAVEQRSDKRPQLSDLRESGSIEQDADAVLFIFREEYYLERSDRRGSPDHIASMGQAEIIIGKQRHGPVGTVALRFDGALTKFSDAQGEPSRQAA